MFMSKQILWNLLTYALKSLISQCFLIYAFSKLPTLHKSVVSGVLFPTAVKPDLPSVLSKNMLIITSFSLMKERMQGQTIWHVNPTFSQASLYRIQRCVCTCQQPLPNCPETRSSCSSIATRHLLPLA